MPPIKLSLIYNYLSITYPFVTYLHPYSRLALPCVTRALALPPAVESGPEHSPWMSCAPCHAHRASRASPQSMLPPQLWLLGTNRPLLVTASIRVFTHLNTKIGNKAASQRGTLLLTRNSSTYN